MRTLPSDPFILLSLINTLLRDQYHSFEALCEEEDFPADQIASKLASIGYVYNKDLNKFI